MGFGFHIIRFNPAIFLCLNDICRGLIIIIIIFFFFFFFFFFFRFFEVIVRFVNIGEIVENITEALLKVALNTIARTPTHTMATTTTAPSNLLSRCVCYRISV